MIDQKELRETFNYNNGSLIVIKTKFKKRLNKTVGSLDKPTGYLRVYTQGRNCLCHRLIYIWHHGQIPEGMMIDHINNQRADNRIENLRLVTHQQNNFNRRNVKGYCWNKARSKWKAQITINGKGKHLGYFDTEQEASDAYQAAKEEYHRFDSTDFDPNKTFHKSTVKGCSFNKRAGKWMAYINISGKRKHLGYFNTEQEARAAHLAAKAIYHIIS